MGCGTSSTQAEYVVEQPKPIQHELQPPQPDPITIHDIPKPVTTLSIEAPDEDHSPPQQSPPRPEFQKSPVKGVSMEGAMVHEKMEQVAQGKAVMFGQSENERRIVLLDCEGMQFSIISSKSQGGSTPQKYQPKQVIFEESQEMLASNLFNNNSHPPYNYMFTTFINPETIFLSGGVNYKFDYVSEQAFLFRLASITQNPPPRRKGYGLVGNKFEKLPCMKRKRFSHMGAHLRIDKLSYIFVFGGRDEEEQLLSSCEQYSVQESNPVGKQTEKWREIAPMHMPRSTGFSLIFKHKVYVFGGYTGEKKRSKVIEVYDPFKNYWETLSVKLHRGIEAGLIFSLKPNQLLLMGGNMQFGALKSTLRINLAEQTYIWDSNMKNERVLQKGVKYKDSIYVFGGDGNDSFERYAPKQRKWKDHNLSYSDYVPVDDLNAYVMATQTIEVEFDQSLLPKVEGGQQQYRKHLIFGNDNYPCILELNTDKWVLKKKAVPMALRLRCHMAVTKIMEGKYFLGGGIDSSEEKPSKAAYLYYSGTNKAIQLPKMHSKKSKATAVTVGQNVYIFGGKNENGDILRQCQKYSLEEEAWVQLPQMPAERMGGKAVVCKDKVLLVGGCDSLQNVTSIDIFDTATDTFWPAQQSLSFSADIKAVMNDPLNPDSGLFLFSHNEVLGKHYCHYLPVHIPQKIEAIKPQQKIEEAFQVVHEAQEREVDLKVLPFSHSFVLNGRSYIVTSKGLFSWQPKIAPGGDGASFVSQIVINQVEMLQFPMEQFSSN